MENDGGNNATCEGQEIKVGKHFPPGFCRKVHISRVHCLQKQNKVETTAREWRVAMRHTRSDGQKTNKKD